MNRTKKILLSTLSSLAVVGVIGGALALGSQGQLAASFAGPGQTGVGGAPWLESYQYTGAVQYVNVPPDTDSMTVVATGGDGGGDSVWPGDEVEGSGAVVTTAMARKTICGPAAPVAAPPRSSSRTTTAPTNRP